MLAAYVEAFNREDPAAALVVGERPDPEPPPGWSVVSVRAAALNHHDVWSCRGVGLRAEQLPMILGCDAAGVDEQGDEVIVHAVITDPGWLGPEWLDPSLSLLSERHQGTLAERVIVPSVNLVPKPAEMSFEQAACLPTAWLTAYRMLFVQAPLRPGDTVLVQGAGGGLSTALVALGHAAGLRMWVTGRSEESRNAALALGADAAFEPAARLPERVDAVMESVGEATWAHSLKALRKGATMVVSGGTSGYTAPTEVARIFAMNLRIVGSTMGSREELERLIAFFQAKGLEAPVDRVLPLAETGEGIAALAAGEVRGKVVLTP